MSTGNKPHYLDHDHPNYLRWQRSREISFERGKFVKSIISKYKQTSNIKVLDIGSGFGGTIQNFLDEKNEIFSVEIDEFKLSNQVEHKSIKKFNCNAFELPFDDKFDVIILQDFIEHIENPEQFLRYIKNYFKDDGIIYLSTPNKLSILNILSDPHWGFPFVSVLPRKLIKKIFIPIFRKNEKYRKDIAELLSLRRLEKIFFKTGFVYQIHTKEAVQTLLNNPGQIIWSDFHLSLLKILKMLKLDKILLRIANNQSGFVNKFLTPTFYFTLKKAT